MHTNAYKALHPVLLNDLDIEEFIFIKKISKKIKMSKVALGMSYAMLMSALWFGSTEMGFTIIVAGLVLIFYFQNRIKYYLELRAEKNELFEDIMRNYISSDKTDAFRELQLSKLKKNEVSKREYLEIVKEDMQLLFSLIKKECNEESSIDIVAYKSSIENLFKFIQDAVESNFVENEELVLIQRKWSSDLQALCNQYAKTDLEVELKYLYSKSSDFNK